MMTIKHIALSGVERIYPTASVRYTPATDSGTTGSPATVWYDVDGTENPLTGGTCFVMNEHGKTVSRYDIGASMAPLPNA